MLAMTAARRVLYASLGWAAVLLALQPWTLLASVALVLVAEEGWAVMQADAAIGWQLKVAMWSAHLFPVLPSLRARVGQRWHALFWLGWGLAWCWLRADPGGHIGRWLD